ncbi:MAG: DSD1 family PLP-dependent enzyme [Thaumarchaeota archaeon]|nr:DSD1 family PLP-dependent enzyme [Nitrososphaerota archaeon]
MNIEELPTPCVLVDLDVLERNIKKMADFTKSRNCGVRPHAKSHKSPFIAKKQMDAGAVGICCQTLVETEAMILNGIDHVLLTHNLASPGMIERFLSLRKNGDIKILVDGPENTEMLAKAARHRGLFVDVLVEVNVGNNKAGKEPGEPAAKFASWVSRVEGLNFKGLQCYEGNLQLAFPNFEERKKLAGPTLQKITATISALKTLGLEPEIVTGGGTGTYNITAGYPGVTDIQPGSYIMMDRRYSEIETVGSDFGQAMNVLSTVVSTPDEKRAVIDMGWKAVGVEYEMLGWGGMPEALVPGVTYSTGGDEHGVLKCDSPSNRPNVGDKVRFVPAHCDTALNLHGVFYGIRGDNVEVACPVARR